MAMKLLLLLSAFVSCKAYKIQIVIKDADFFEMCGGEQSQCAAPQSYPNKFFVDQVCICPLPSKCYAVPKKSSDTDFSSTDFYACQQQCPPDNVCGTYNATTKLFSNQLCQCPTRTYCQEANMPLQKKCRAIDAKQKQCATAVTPSPCWKQTESLPFCFCNKGSCPAPVGGDSNCTANVY